METVSARMRDGSIPVDIFLTHCWGFEEVPQAFEQVRHGEVIKGLVTIDQ